MKLVSASILILGLFLCLAAVTTAAGCNQQCSSNGDCTTSSCSHCFSGKCQSGLPCGAPCSINTDCYTLGSCPYCQAGVCGSTPVYSASATATTNPRSSASPSASPSAYPSRLPSRTSGISASASLSPYPTPLVSASRSPYPSPSSIPTPVAPSASVSPHPLYPSMAKLCVGIGPNNTYYNYETCGPNVPVLVEGNWTSGECQKYTATQGFSDYALGCLGKNGVYVGTGHYPPGSDCGWITNKAPYIYKNQTKLCSLAYGQTPCANQLATITAGDGWTAGQCSYFVKVIQNLIYKSGYNGYQLGCAFDSPTGVFSLGNKQGSIPPLDCGWTNPPTLEPKLDNTRYNSTKFCGFIGGSDQEINVINVLNTWTSTNCYAYATENNSSKFFLGCITFDSFSIGQVGGFAPSVNCGW